MIPEAVSQVAMLVMGHDVTIAMACAAGSLELNPFLPLVAACLLESIELVGPRRRNSPPSLHRRPRGR